MVNSISLTIIKEIEYICLIIVIVMGKSYLSEFEDLILTVVAILGDQAYGNAIVEEIWSQIGRQVNLNTVHITLYRLEDRGLVKSHYGGATASRGGRRKRFFIITSTGLDLIRIQREQKTKLWNLIPGLKLNFT